MLTEQGPLPTTLDGRYELVGQLGRGGMGTVHRAVDHRLRRTVAVKLLSEELAHHPSSRERFQREAHAVAKLNHPAVATIYDVGVGHSEGGPQPYIVMEYVEGVTLAEALRGSEFPLEYAVTVACEVLDALEHSHRHGIVHRDIKPSNVMLSGPATVKVLDFGIAKALTDAATQLTGNGAALGTPAYSAPEQIAGGSPVDHRADLYAMGCLLYEILTGRPPFHAESTFALLHKQLYAEPEPLSRRRPQVPAAVEAVVARALRKNPAERHPDAATMRAELANALTQPDSHGATAEYPATASYRATRVHQGVEIHQPNAALPTEAALQPATEPPLPGAPDSASRLRSTLRMVIQGGPALMGCLLSLLCVRGQAVETAHFGWVAGAAALLSLALLPISPRLASVAAWGPVAEAFAVNSGFRRYNMGWDSSYVGIAVLLAVTAALCLAGVARSRTDGHYAVIAFWFSSTGAIWFFLDDLRKLFVFYGLWSTVTFAAAVYEGFERRRRMQHRRSTPQALSAPAGRPWRDFDGVQPRAPSMTKP